MPKVKKVGAWARRTTMPCYLPAVMGLGAFVLETLPSIEKEV
jgi:hypothetical protein